MDIQRQNKHTQQSFLRTNTLLKKIRCVYGWKKSFNFLVCIELTIFQEIPQSNLLSGRDNISQIFVMVNIKPPQHYFTQFSFFKDEEKEFVHSFIY